MSDNIESYVLLYSKYSPACNSILDIIKKNMIVNVISLCIDNKKIRKRITQKGNIIKIELVPCILIIYQSNYIEKYEGKQAFDIIERMIMYSNKSDENIEQKTSISTKSEEISKHEVSTIGFTNLNDLIDENVVNKDENQSSHLNLNNKIPIRNGAGGYDITEVDRSAEDTSRVLPNISNKINSKTGDSSNNNNNLMSAALAMQKERESVDAAVKPVD